MEMKKRIVVKMGRKTKVVNKKKEVFDVYIGRGSIWGNPFKIGADGTREEVIEKYRQYLIENPELVIHTAQLKGKILGCFCTPLPCHGDILAKIANGEEW